MSTRSPARMTQLALNLARTNPEFALRVSQRLTGEARQGFLEAALRLEPSAAPACAQPSVAKPSAASVRSEPNVTAARPGLKKCGSTDRAASLAATPPISPVLFGFARSVSRVAN